MSVSVLSFLPSDCSRFCVPRNDADGHYKCDHNGNRVCLEGYRDPTTNCTQCVTATGCCKEIQLLHMDTVYIGQLLVCTLSLATLQKL